MGVALEPKQRSDFLLVVSQLKVYREGYDAWEDCLGAFMQSMGPTKFFEQLPLKLLDYDLNSLTYAQDSRSYLLHICRQKLRTADIVYFAEFCIPMVQ